MRTIIIAFSIFLAIFLTADLVVGYELNLWQSMLGYMVIYTLVAMFAANQASTETAESRRLASLPLSGPVARRSPNLFYALITFTSLLSVFNPLQLGQQLLQMGGQLLIYLRYRNKGGLPTAETYRQTTVFSLPFAPQSEWYVIKGGVTPETSHSWEIYTQRYAYDFVVVQDGLQRHREQGTALEAYYCYDLPITAAADGEVVAVRDGIRNAPFLGYGLIDFMAWDFRGNSVTIRHEEQEYSFYAHFIPGSITVRPGDQVQRGQIIGRCGHSGHSSEPHLHFHVQDRANFFTAMGLPVRFSRLSVDGQPQAESIFLQGGMRVSCQADA